MLVVPGLGNVVQVSRLMLSWPRPYRTSGERYKQGHKAAIQKINPKPETLSPET